MPSTSDITHQYPLTPFTMCRPPAGRVVLCKHVDGTWASYYFVYQKVFGIRRGDPDSDKMVTMTLDGNRLTNTPDLLEWVELPRDLRIEFTA